jgi:hypothetical protein
MQLSDTDIALLGAMRTWAKEDLVASLKHIISFYDYYNRDILSYPEFSSTMSKLLAIEALVLKDGKPAAGKDYQAWRSKKYAIKTVTIPKEIKDTKEFLEKHIASLNTPIIPAEFTIWQDEFEAAKVLYLKK